MRLLEKLINAVGISGDEGAVRNIIIKEARKYMKDVRVDSMGNVVVRKRGMRPAVMLIAHMDEIGLIVSAINDQGHILLSSVGGLDPAILLGQRVYVLGKKKIMGVITTSQTSNNKDAPKKIKLDKLYVDCGLPAPQLKKLGVNIGDYISFTEATDCVSLGSKDVLSGTALDDRVGCYMLLELMKNLKTKNEIYFVFTVQEEMGLYGARASVFNIEPDYALAIDVTGADDGDRKLDLGNGPVLMIKDAEMLANKCLNDSLEHAASKAKIQLQYDVNDFGSTDAASIFAAKGGIPSGVLGVVVRNLHTTIGMVDVKDIDDCMKVLKRFLRNPPDKCWA